LHTGGFDFGEISTKSNPSPSAIEIALSIGTTPFFSPEAPINNTSLASI
jgi:hypothetical protein